MLSESWDFWINRRGHLGLESAQNRTLFKERFLEEFGSDLTMSVVEGKKIAFIFKEGLTDMVKAFTKDRDFSGDVKVLIKASKINTFCIGSQYASPTPLAFDCTSKCCKDENIIDKL